MDISQSIKEDIVKSLLPRGVPLRQTTLSVRYGVSRIPIRDALRSLKAEGWLVSHGKVGVMIPDLDWKEAEDLCLMRAELECLLFGMAFSRIQADDIIEARRILSELDQENVALIHRGELNWRFHQALYRAADRPTLQRVVEGLNKQAVRYLGFQYGPLGYRTESQNQHEALLLLIEKKDKCAALVLLRQHIEEAGALLADYLKANA
ncbi:GntR family transcriptional regulator [Marinomonas sp. M1K-6]|uniref:GntR family transcriptional regulator n=1 Tax=Marinomonas profundi TaxID=2726122 RepID=A0A847R4C5_9GAMM|nr:GntR family transcriptional regulator [Marinomonas profundi]NLQ18832.1 GntR family transcriptional regulator [Marinomonas profundi]UDV02962.1 GntR family transcriptional regulator [Marinomonas profundi]